MREVQRGRIIIASFHFTIFDITNLPMERKQQKLIYLSPSSPFRIFALHVHNAHQNIPHRHHHHRFHFYVTRKNVSRKNKKKKRPRKPKTKLSSSFMILFSSRNSSVSQNGPKPRFLPTFLLRFRCYF
jgi:hypothetical protein